MKSGMESLGQVRTQAVVLLLLAFLAGAFGGGALERVLLHRAARARYAEGHPGSGGGPQGAPQGASRGGDPMSGFYKWLNVTDSQKVKIDAIFAKRRPHMDSLDVLRRAAFDSARVEMDAVLTVDQRAKLDSSRARSGSNRGGRGFGPPGGRR